MITNRHYDGWLSLNLIHFEELERFLEEVESLWGSRLKDYEEMANEIEDKEIREEYYEYHYDEWVIYRDDFPRIAKYSVFVSSFAYFEKLCSEYYRRAIKLNTTLEKYNSDRIHAFDYVIWFRKNFGKDIVPKHTFHMFDEINQVRNRIVHSNGKVDKIRNKGLVNIITKSSFLALNHHNEIEMKNEYIRDVMRVLSDLISIIHNCVYKR